MFVIILMGKRELVALLLVSSLFLVTVCVLWLFLAVPWAGLHIVIMVFPDHTHFCCVWDCCFDIVVDMSSNISLNIKGMMVVFFCYGLTVLQYQSLQVSLIFIVLISFDLYTSWSFSMFGRR